MACVTEDGVQHAVNSTWKSDLCTTSTCVSRDNGVLKFLYSTFDTNYIGFVFIQLQVESTRENCEEPTAEDRLLYVYDKVQPQDQCCPIYRRKACLFDNKEYKVRFETLTNFIILLIVKFTYRLTKLGPQAIIALQ